MRFCAGAERASAAEEKARRLEASLSEANTQLSEARGQLTEARGQLTEARGQLSEVRAGESCAAEKDVQRLEASLSEVRGQLSDTNTQLSEVRGQLSETKTQLSEVRGQLRDTNTQLSEARGQLSEARRQLTEARGQLSEVHELRASLAAHGEHTKLCRQDASAATAVGSNEGVQTLLSSATAQLSDAQAGESWVASMMNDHSQMWCNTLWPGWQLRGRLFFFVSGLGGAAESGQKVQRLQVLLSEATAELLESQQRVKQLEARLSDVAAQLSQGFAAPFRVFGFFVSTDPNTCFRWLCSSMFS